MRGGWWRSPQGRDCERLIREKILEPLKLHNTFYDDEKPYIQDRFVPSYSNTKTERLADFSGATTSWADLACGMYASAADMAVWADMLICGDFLDDASNQGLLGFLPAMEEAEYGLCVARKTMRGEQVILLQGNVPGYSSAVFMGDTVCAVLCNLSDYSGKDLCYAEIIAEALMFSAVKTGPAYD